MKSDKHETISAPLWRNHNYLLLQGGQLVSFLGNQQQFIAIPLLVLALTGSAVQAGLAVGLRTIAALVVSPLAGALVDTWDRKRTMKICDAGRMLLTLTLSLAFWFHVLTMLQIYAVVTLASVFGTLFSVANTAALHIAITEGVEWLWKQQLLRFLTLVNGADSLRYGAGYLVILVLAEQLHASSVGIGAIFTGAAAGALLGNLVSSRVRQHMSFGKIAISMLWLEALMFPLYAVAPNAIVLCFVAPAEEFVGPMYTVALDSCRLMATHDTLRGRASSSVQVVVQGAGSVGAILGGILIQDVGAQGSALLLGAWLLVLAMATTLNKQVRHAALSTTASAAVP